MQAIFYEADYNQKTVSVAKTSPQNKENKSVGDCLSNWSEQHGKKLTGKKKKKPTELTVVFDVSPLTKMLNDALLTWKKCFDSMCLEIPI